MKIAVLLLLAVARQAITLRSKAYKVDEILAQTKAEIAAKKLSASADKLTDPAGAKPSPSLETSAQVEEGGSGDNPGEPGEQSVEIVEEPVEQTGQTTGEQPAGAELSQTTLTSAQAEEGVSAEKPSEQSEEIVQKSDEKTVQTTGEKVAGAELSPTTLTSAQEAGGSAENTGEPSGEIVQKPDENTAKTTGEKFHAKLEVALMAGKSAVSAKVVELEAKAFSKSVGKTLACLLRKPEDEEEPGTEDGEEPGAENGEKTGTEDGEKTGTEDGEEPGTKSCKGTNVFLKDVKEETDEEGRIELSKLHDFFFGDTPVEMIQEIIKADPRFTLSSGGENPETPEPALMKVKEDKDYKENKAKEIKDRKDKKAKAVKSAKAFAGETAKLGAATAGAGASALKWTAAQMSKKKGAAETTVETAGQTTGGKLRAMAFKGATGVFDAGKKAASSVKAAGAAAGSSASAKAAELKEKHDAKVFPTAVQQTLACLLRKGLDPGTKSCKGTNVFTRHEETDLQGWLELSKLREFFGDTPAADLQEIIEADPKKRFEVNPALGKVRENLKHKAEKAEKARIAKEREEKAVALAKAGAGGGSRGSPVRRGCGSKGRDKYSGRSCQAGGTQQEQSQ